MLFLNRRTLKAVARRRASPVDSKFSQVDPQMLAVVPLQGFLHVFF